MEERAGWGKDLPELLRNNTWNYAICTADKALNARSTSDRPACHVPAAYNYVFGVKKMQATASAK
jgi:hypothetical protein